MIHRKFDWKNIDMCEHDVLEYYNDIPVFLLAKDFLNLKRIDENTYFDCIKIDGVNHAFIIDKINNKIFNNGVEMDPECFIQFVLNDYDINPSIFIEQSTGVILDDYIKTIYYKGGYKEEFNIKKDKFTLLKYN